MPTTRVIHAPSSSIGPISTNVIHACVLSCWEHFASLLFKDDLDRVIYATNDFAFRRRLQLENSNSDLNLPFMNLYIDSIDSDTDREWWHSVTNTHGIYIPELRKSLRLLPMKVSFEASVFIHKAVDQQVVFEEMSWDAGNETILEPTIEIAGQSVKLPGVLNYDLDFDTEYKESDWLEKSRIRVIGVNPSIDCFFIKAPDEAITSRFIFNISGRSVNEYVINEVSDGN